MTPTRRELLAGSSGLMLSAFAGCSGYNIDSPSATTTQTQNGQATTSNSEIRRGNVTESMVYHFKNLSARERDFFSLVIGNDTTIPSHNIPQRFQPNGSIRFVKYQDSLYQINRSKVHLIRYAIRITKIGMSENISDGDVRNYENLSRDEKATFNILLSETQKPMYYSPEDVPFEPGTYIIERNQTRYELSVYHADFQGVEFTVNLVK